MLEISQNFGQIRLLWRQFSRKVHVNILAARTRKVISGNSSENSKGILCPQEENDPRTFFKMTFASSSPPTPATQSGLRHRRARSRRCQAPARWLLGRGVSF